MSRRWLYLCFAFFLAAIYVPRAHASADRVSFMHDIVIDEIANPPSSPEECIFARTTETISADLKTQITPCQFGGEPDCAQCGCIASMGLAAVGHYKVLGALTAGHLFMASDRLGKSLRGLQEIFSPRPVLATEPNPFKIL